MTRHRAPSKLLWAAEFPRAVGSTVLFARARRALRAAPRGDGRPVMILPGLVNSDRANFVLRRYLRRLGYRVEGWGLGHNLGSRAIGMEGERLFDRIRALHDETGEPVTLIGISLGGIMARLAAHRLNEPGVPGVIREVITISSPYAGHPRATNVWRAFELLSGERIDSDRVIAQRAEVAMPLSVPVTAIWSRSDGFVNGMICHAPGEPGCRAIEVRSGHVWVQSRPAVLLAVAATLAGGQRGDQRGSGSPAR